MRYAILIIAIFFMITACTPAKDPAIDTPIKEVADEEIEETSIAEKEEIVSNIDNEIIENEIEEGETMANPIVTFDTTKGTFTAEIYLQQAPITAGNFLELVNRKFYDGLTFHRYEPGFVIQGGDPKGDGTGGSDKTINLEIIDGLVHDVGALSMARTNDPNSATSQFFVVIGEAHFLDGQYAVFGKIVSGMENVNKIRAGDKMMTVRVTN